MDRLELLSSSLAGRLRLASLEKQRAASVVACEFAVTAAAIDEPLASDALRRLRAGELMTEQKKAELAAKAALLDSQYLDLQDEVDAGKANAVDGQRAFAVARAWSALSLASSDSPSAFSEAIYEAAAAMGDEKTRLFATLELNLI
jgi:hypothetical protein